MPINISENLTRRFAIISLIVLVGGMLSIGLMVGQLLQRGVLNRSADLTAAYLDSLFTHHLVDVSMTHPLPPHAIDELEHVINSPGLIQRMAIFKLWSLEGQILYSNQANIIGQFFDNSKVATAAAGEVISAFTSLDSSENEPEAELYERLIEIYAPIYNPDGDVIAVAEFYMLPSALESEILSAQARSWVLLIIATGVMYVLLNGMVDQANYTIQFQQDRLARQVHQLNNLLQQNADLTHRVRQAAAQSAASTEIYLRRISADLHDGPAQDMALALLRMDSLIEETETPQPPKLAQLKPDLEVVRNAVDAGLRELREISAGLRMPELAELTPAESVRRAVYDYERKWQRTVTLNLSENLPSWLPLSTKIALYRITHEALTNGNRHAPGVEQTVAISRRDTQIELKIQDAGAGFNVSQPPSDGRLGLITMRERAELLGGTFDIESSPRGTLVYTALPFTGNPQDSPK